MKLTLMTLVLAAIGFAQYPPPFCPPKCANPPDTSTVKPTKSPAVKKPIKKD